MPIAETLQRYLTEAPGLAAQRVGVSFWTGRQPANAPDADTLDSQKLAG